MPLIWLRVAVAFYAVGLLYSLLLLSKRGNLLAKVVEPAVGLGLIFHFLSLVQTTVQIGQISQATIHAIGYHALLFGFPFMTFGIVTGSVFLIEKYGPTFFFDQKILVSFMMWGVSLLLLFMRWSSGWRGRRAAFLVAFAFLIAICA